MKSAERVYLGLYAAMVALGLLVGGGDRLMVTILALPHRDDVVRAGGRLLTVRAVHGDRVDAVRMSSPARRVEHLVLGDIEQVIVCSPGGAR